MATRQLVLLPTDEERWRLDERTKAVGRAGLAQARQALAAHPDQDGSRRPVAA